jgi:hypothetical protein
MVLKQSYIKDNRHDQEININLCPQRVLNLSWKRWVYMVMWLNK